nr:CbtB domain-containing protein [uncultured Duganella sp.]
MSVTTIHAGAAGDRNRAVALRDRIVAGLMAAGLGAALLFGAGFASMEALHNAAHDSRHSAGFPCH